MNKGQNHSMVAEAPPPHLAKNSQLLRDKM